MFHTDVYYTGVRGFRWATENLPNCQPTACSTSSPPGFCFLGRQLPKTGNSAIRDVCPNQQPTDCLPSCLSFHHFVCVCRAYMYHIVASIKDICRWRESTHFEHKSEWWRYQVPNSCHPHHLGTSSPASEPAVSSSCYMYGPYLNYILVCKGFITNSSLHYIKLCKSWFP